MKAIKPITATPAGEVVPIKMVQYGTVVALELRFDQLERENAELRKLLEELKDIIKQVRYALRVALPEARSTHCEKLLQSP